MLKTIATLFLLGFILLLQACQSERSTMPNIVIIFIDDQGYNDLGCYGAEGFETPNIDHLASEGLKFTNFYVSEAVCSASRASLLTGCYAQRVSIRGALNAIAFTGLHPEETTLASILRSEGYKTAIYGKWHLGHRFEFLPMNFGFDEYFGLPYSNDMWPVDYSGLPQADGYKSLYPELALIKDSIRVKDVANLRDQAELTTLYTQQAVDFIYRNQDNPFFLYLPHSMVHVPLGVSDKFKGQSEQGMYGDVMMEVDWSVGEVMRTLEETGLDKNTIVIYTSDNGPWLNFGKHAGSAYPLREGKGTAWEGGVRVPCIVRWPDKIEAGRTTDQLVTTLDLLPTIAAITGADLPEKKIDGLDVTGVLFTDTAVSPRDEFFYYYEGTLRAIRKGKWKLMLPHRSRSYEGLEPGRDGFPGPTSTIDVPLALYDLEADVGEQNNLLSQYPEQVKALERMADSVRQVLGDGITGQKGAEVRECGRIRGADSVPTIAAGKSIKLLYPPNPRYTADGPGTLVNGLIGSYDFLDGRWMGFRDEGLDATIDLGQKHDIQEIKVRFLQNQISWIFLPGELIILASDDGKEFNVVHQETIDNTTQDLSIRIGQPGVKTDISARFIRVQAKAIGSCPDWHPGKGEKGWLFVDEISIN